MGLPWKLPQRRSVDEAMRRFPAESGKCAALARAVLKVARPLDADASGLQVLPRGSALFIVPRHPKVKVWYTHTLVRTRLHHVDALTGTDGCEQEAYLERHWQYPEGLELRVVDVDTVDPGIQNGDG